MLIDHTILALAWIIYGILHSVFAAIWFKEKAKKWLGNKYRFYRFFYSLFATAGFFLILIFQLSIETKKLFIPGTALTIAGALIALSGSIIMMLYVFNTGVIWLFREEAGQRLVQKGIHRFVRHPLYSGTFLLIWGLWLLFPTISLLIMNIVIVFYTLIAIPFEEKKLIAIFGEDYLIYRKQTPGLIPRIRLFKR